METYRITVSTRQDPDGFTAFVFSDGKEMRNQTSWVKDVEMTRLTLEMMVNLPETDMIFVSGAMHRYVPIK